MIGCLTCSSPTKPSSTKVESGTISTECSLPLFFDWPYRCKFYQIIPKALSDYSKGMSCIGGIYFLRPVIWANFAKSQFQYHGSEHLVEMYKTLHWRVRDSIGKSLKLIVWGSRVVKILVRICALNVSYTLLLVCYRFDSVLGDAFLHFGSRCNRENISKMVLMMGMGSLSSGPVV